jgi:hypothetical protein
VLAVLACVVVLSVCHTSNAFLPLPDEPPTCAMRCVFERLRVTLSKEPLFRTVLLTSCT